MPMENWWMSQSRLNSDKTRYEVKWTKGGLAKLPGRVMSLRFKIQDASLYSFWFGERRGQ